MKESSFLKTKGNKKMKIEVADGTCVLVELTKEDMQAYGITYDDIITHAKKAECALCDILCALKEEKDDGLCAAKYLKAEFLPGVKGGCLVILKALREEKSDYRLFETESIDALLDCAKAFVNTALPDSSLFYDGTTYRLLVNEEALVLGSTVHEFLEEVFTDSREVERTKEYMSCILESRALEILAGN